jgi:glutaminyl-tRNA synthetase
MLRDSPPNPWAQSRLMSDRPAARRSNFLTDIVDADLAAGRHTKVVTRFPPEPNGYLHIGHAKSIALNFGLAQQYGGVCHLRLDDTNPVTEDTDYVESIQHDVAWLGGNWDGEVRYASNYFGQMYALAERLVTDGKAYVDGQTVEEIRKNRGDFTTPGVASPYRDRPIEESLELFRRMKAGEFADGTCVLRARIDMGHANVLMRDPLIYRIRHAHHHRTGDEWCIYPMYDYAHPLEDAIEGITHSICTLEFETNRELYDWFLDHTGPWNPRPRQYEFARLALGYTVMSKRKLLQLVVDKRVSGWDDPRMPTIVGLRRRGYTPESLHLMHERTGTSKAGGWTDYSVLEGCLRDDLETKALRGMAVLNPVKLIMTNWDDVMGAGHLEPCSQPALPHPPEGVEPPPARHFTIGKEVWIEREDFEEVPPKGYKRLFPGNKVRLKGGYVIECTGCIKDIDGVITDVLATVVPDTKSGTPGSDAVKVKAAITWVAVANGVNAEVRMYDRLFLDPHPDAGGKDFIESLNPNSLKVVTAIVEPSLANALPDQKFQFERHGYFVADRVDHVQGSKPVFNLAVGLKDSWGK